MSAETEGSHNSRIPFIKDASENDASKATEVLGEESVCTEGAQGDGTGSQNDPPKKKHVFTRRDVLAMCGCGVAGLIAGGVLASWGVTERSIESGRIDLRTTPLKMIVTDRAKCSGCQRCEMSCTLKNDGRVCQHIARVRVWDNYYYGAGVGTGDGIFEDCQFTVAHCKQCEDPWCANYCPVHAIYADPKTGARVVDDATCIGCGMCAQACPWNMPRIDSETNVSTKCVSCGRCAEQCPNGAIQFVDWKNIAQAALDAGVVRTITLVDA